MSYSFPFILIGCAIMLESAELPIRKVVLYKNGVGYFERAGELTAGQSAQLQFSSGEMNDVLKSLTLRVQGSGGIRSVRYDSQEPVARKLERFPIKIGERAPLSALLDQLKGAEVEWKSGNETVTGVIVGARAIAASGQQKEQETLTLLMPNGEMRVFEIGPFAQLRFPDPQLQQQFRDYLRTLTQARATDRRTVHIESSDEARRQVSAHYLTPAPVWKSSYRFIFPAEGQPTLEGWAIVDNTSFDDWNDVLLTVVSGRPISFISRLYDPRYVERPVAELPEDTPAAPVLHEAALAAPPPPPPGILRARKSVAERQMAFATESVGGAAPAADAPSSLEGAAEGREAGELFEYSFAKPVTVRKNESAMLPFLQEKVSARKLLIYSDRSSVNPTNAVELSNTTGKTLDGGPVTVYDGGSYAGEALTETVKTGDKRLLSYGVDVGTRVTTKLDSGAEIVREVHLRRGVLTTRSVIAEKTTYTIRNVDARAKSLIIEHPVRQNYRLLNQKPVESTPNAHRFEVKLAPAGETTFAVEEERQLNRTYTISNVNSDFLLSLIQNRELSAEARQALEQIAARQREIAGLDRQLREGAERTTELTADQERARQNLSTLSRVPGQQDQVQTFARRVAEIDAEIASLRVQSNELRKQRQAADAALNSLIEKLSF